jgi:PAS domain S-box-containing protein
MHINITERKLAEEKATAQLELLKMASVAGKLGAWAMEPEPFWSEEIYHLHEIPLDYPLTHEAALNFFTPDSRRKLEKAIATNKPYEIELDFVTAKGRKLWVRVTCAMDFRNGKKRRYGILQDLTERKNAEKNLRESEERYRLIFDRNPRPMYVYDVETLGFLAVNQAATQYYGYTRDEFRAMTMEDLRAFDDPPIPTLPAGSAGHKFSCLYRQRKSDGEIVDVEMHSDTILLNGRQAQLVLINDVTDRLRAESVLRQSEFLLRIAGRAAKIGGWAVDLPEFRCTWSDQVCLLHDLPPHSPITLEDSFAFATPEHRESLRRAFYLCAGEGVPFEIEAEVVTAKGRHIQARIVGQAERDGGGRIARVLGTFQDVTESRKVELELSRTNRALKMLISCNETLLRVEEEPALLKEICEIAVNVGGYRMAWIGYAQDDAEKNVQPMASAGQEDNYLSDVRVSWSEQAPNGNGPVGRAIRSAQPRFSQDILEESAGQPWLGDAEKRGFRSILALPLTDRDHVFGVLALYSSEVKKVSTDEIKLLREMGDNLAYGIRHIRAQQERRRMEQVVLKVATAVSAGTGSEFFEDLALNMAEALGAQVAIVARLQPGDPPTARTIGSWVYDTMSENFTYVLADSPCRHLTTTDEFVVLEKVAEKYPGFPLMDDLDLEAYVGHPLKDSNGQIVGFLSVFFQEPLKHSDLITSTLRIFASRAASELERQSTEEKLREQASLIDKARDAIFVRDLDHRVVYWNKSAELLYGWTAEEAVGRISTDLVYKDPDEFKRANDHLLQHGEWAGELHQVNRAGHKLIVESRWTLVRDARGRPYEILVINTDITERKHMEAQFLRAQRMESLGTLAGGIAHDMNNVLGPILMAVEMLSDKENEKEWDTMLKILRTSSQHGVDLVRQVLSFARGIEGERIAMNLAYVIQEIQKIIRDTFPKNIEFEFYPASGLWTLHADPTQIHQVFMNLCVNARDAMPNGGKLTITLDNAMLDDVYVSMYPDFKPGAYVVARVIDNGIGIPPAIQEKIFEPFFTTKEVGKGTGLGLSTSLNIIKSHGGFIQINSIPGQETVFTIYLPADSETQPAEGPLLHEEPELPRGHGELIMVVDDEENFRTVSKTTLERYGYRVLLAAHGAEAVALYAQHRDTIDLVLTDMAMPVMDGAHTIFALKAINPKIRIICSSGGESKGGASKAAYHGVRYFIPKPYTSDVMLRTIAEALSAPEAGTPPSQPAPAS